MGWEARQQPDKMKSQKQACPTSSLKCSGVQPWGRGLVGRARLRMLRQGWVTREVPSRGSQEGVLEPFTQARVFGHRCCVLSKR